MVWVQLGGLALLAGVAAVLFHFLADAIGEETELDEAAVEYQEFPGDVDVVGRATYGFLPVPGVERVVEVKEWHARLVSNALIILLVLVFAVMLLPAVVKDYEVKQSLEADLEERGCSAVLSHARAGNVSLQGPGGRGAEWFLNTSEESELEFNTSTGGQRR